MTIGTTVAFTRRVFVSAAALAVATMAAPSFAAPSVGEAAPEFTGLTSNGDNLSLSDLAGQKVILEWTNHDCPYVRKHYETNNMQSLQSEAGDAGYVWVSVISSAPGKQGHVEADQANQLTVDRGAAPAHVVLDPSGDIGRLYAAKTSPHMFVIDEAGVLQYAGAIDDKNSADHSTVETAQNYVRMAMASLAAGEAVAPAQTQPYGCSVKY